MASYKTPRLVIAAVQGRSGKTTCTIGLLRALKNRGLLAQPYKKGPDYIDPSWHTLASGVPCRNLDAVMMQKDQIIHSLVSHTQGHDLAIIEGAMGIFDGLDVEGSNSTAELAYLTKSPVILVVSGQRITRSVAAIINGVIAFDPRITVKGILLNQVARPRHEGIMRSAIEKYCGVPILGALPKTRDIEIPDRHLGLIPAGEREALAERIERLGALMERHVDIDALLRIAQEAPALEDAEVRSVFQINDKAPTIGVFKDRAFSFYYPENIEALQEQGARIVYIDACKEALPEVDGLYIGGGFPEVLAEILSANQGLRKAVKEKAEDDMPIYAECGGLMYLCESIRVDNIDYPMAGVFPAKVVMEKKPQGHGYAIQEATEDNPFFHKGTKVYGHEFHHSRLIVPEGYAPKAGYATKRGEGAFTLVDTLCDGLIYRHTMASYHHFHAASDAQWAKNFVALAQGYKEKR